MSNSVNSSYEISTASRGLRSPAAMRCRAYETSDIENAWSCSRFERRGDACRVVVRVQVSNRGDVKAAEHNENNIKKGKSYLSAIEPWREVGDG